MLKRRSFAGAVAALAGPTLWPLQARAQAATRLLVGFASGGAVDVVARIIAGPLGSALQRNVIVENKAGAGGLLAVQSAIAAAPDGTTLLVCPASVLTLRPHTESSVRIDPLTQLTPVSTLCEYHFAVAVGPATPARTLEEFVAWCRANPEQASFGSPGAGTAPHLLGELFARQTGVKLTHVAYRGGAQAMTDVLGGQVPAMFTTLPNAIAQHNNGRVRILAVSSAQRLAAAPSVPTFQEQGHPDFTAAEWFGLLAPAGTPEATVAALNAAVRGVLADPEVSRSIDKAGYVARGTSAAELRGMVAAESQRWKAVVDRLGMGRK